jgi:hypothetical protein
MASMGTFYSLGIVQDFTAKSTGNTSIELGDLEVAVGDRLNLDLFSLRQGPGGLLGQLKPGTLEEHLEDFVRTLKQIANQHSRIDEYWNLYGCQWENYPREYWVMEFKNAQGQGIKLSGMALFLFIEGKVGADEFEIEPLLLNWLFRHSSLENPLAGAVVSIILG